MPEGGFTCARIVEVQTDLDHEILILVNYYLCCPAELLRTVRSQEEVVNAACFGAATAEAVRCDVEPDFNANVRRQPRSQRSHQKKEKSSVARGMDTSSRSGTTYDTVWISGTTYDRFHRGVRAHEGRMGRGVSFFATTRMTTSHVGRA